MHSWQNLVDETALATVLPADYARFARPVSEALGLFLTRLPAEQQAEILARQVALPTSASISERLGLLALSCPVLHKLGQVLARDQRLAPQLRHHLRALESLPPTVTPSAIQEVLTRELGPLSSLGIALAPPAIAEASVGVVIPFATTSGPEQGKPQGVFKILKPGVDQRLEVELELLAQIGSYLDERCEALQIPSLDYEEAFQQVREKLLWEIRLDEEQRHLANAARFYASEPRVQIPRVLPYCTPRVTAMERIVGRKVTDHGLTDRGDPGRLARLVVQAMISAPVFSPDNPALFHCDPHAGNLFLTDSQRLAILDWSLVGSLGERERIAIVQLMLGAVTLDARRIVTILAGLSDRADVDWGAIQHVVHGWLGRIRQGHLPGLSWLTGMLDEAVQRGRLRVAADLLMFRKSLLTLEGVVAEIGAGSLHIDDVLMADFCRCFAREWPRRWLSTPNSRAFATRLSNVDLTQTLLSWPAAVARFWLDPSLDVLTGDAGVDNIS